MKLMEVPKAIFRQVSSAEDVYKLMDNFFVNTKEYIMENLGDKVDPFF